MGKKKKALLRYKRLGTISKKLEKKFSNFLKSKITPVDLDTKKKESYELESTTTAVAVEEEVKEEMKRIKEQKKKKQEESK